MKLFLLLSLLNLVFLSWCVVSSVPWWVQSSSWAEQSKSLISSQICIAVQCFKIEIADNDETRHRGLMYRQSLASDAWMLFVFDQSWIYPFRMKNTLIPLDMIWISDKNEVVDIQTAVPCITPECKLYSPVWSARYVLEINAWLAKQYNFKTWTIVTIQ